jgi:hypothetical protein
MSLSSYVLSCPFGAPVTAIPVFPSRAFQRHGIYVHADSGIERPASPDKGNRIAEYLHITRHGDRENRTKSESRAG